MSSLSEKQIKKEVRKTKRTYGLSTNITVDEIKRGLKKLGYDFYTFESGKEEIEKHNLSGWMHYPCFSVTKEEIRAVFINSHKSEFETLILLSHELGHIVLNHYTSRRNLSKDLQEHEASQFAVLLLKTPNPYTTYMRLFSCCCGILALCILVYMFAPQKTIFIEQNQPPAIIDELQIQQPEIQTEPRKETSTYIAPPSSNGSTNNKSGANNNKTGTSNNVSTSNNNTAAPNNNAVQQQPTQTKPAVTEPTPQTVGQVEQKATTEPTPQQPSTVTQEPKAPVVTTPKQEVNQSEMVVVTTTGKKYHKPTCGHVKNRETRSLTINEAVQQGYSACLNCFR